MSRSAIASQYSTASAVETAAIQSKSACADSRINSAIDLILKDAICLSPYYTSTMKICDNINLLSRWVKIDRDYTTQHQ
jgi:hypothetical protein